MAEAAAPATMAEAAAPAPHLRGLPDEIAIWEILVRLPPKAVLRCRAVCPAWRRATSSRDFLLAHHARQPTLPLVRGYTGDSLNIIPFDHRAELAAAAADQLQSIARLGPHFFRLEASCDGLLVLSVNIKRFCICNPATRQYALLPLLTGFSVGAMYMHPPTGEYRLLMSKDQDLIMLYNELPPGAEYVCYVYTVGSNQWPRQIPSPDMRGLIDYHVPVLFHGGLHWHTGQMIMVFDTTAESFRQMPSPIVSGDADLFEFDGMLGMYSLNDDAAIMDIWAMQDYEGEVWAFKHRVELPVAEIAAQFEEFDNYWTMVVKCLDGDVIMLVRFGDRLFQVDINGKLVTSFHRRGLATTQHRLKQTLVPHAFFPTLEGYVVNASPFV